VVPQKAKGNGNGKTRKPAEKAPAALGDMMFGDDDADFKDF
jgi:hypothetical protein